jgi:hypothetical protein
VGEKVENVEKKRRNPLKKIVLLFVGLGITGYVGHLTYMSVTYKPTKVRVSNITDSSFTVSWVTESPMRGIVYYKENDNFLPGPLAWVGSSKAVDDRDYARAQSECVEEFNVEAGKTVSDDFVVSGTNFDCEDVEVNEHGEYFTHHVTLRNLDDESEYYFRVGNTFWYWDRGVEGISTFAQLEDIREPTPIFGKIANEEGVYTDDSIIYAVFENGREGKESIVYSSVTNEQGGWYLDGSYIRTADGELVGMESGQDLFKANAQYMNYGLSDTYEWLFGYFGGNYPDIVVKEELSSAEMGFLRKFISRVMARPTIDLETQEGPHENMSSSTPTTSTSTSTPSTSTQPPLPSWLKEDDPKVVAIQTAAKPGATKEQKEVAAKATKEIGYGNAAKIVSHQNNGTFTSEDLNTIGLSDNAGNVSALTGIPIKQVRYDEVKKEAAVNGSKVNINLSSSSAQEAAFAGSAEGDGVGDTEPLSSTTTLTVTTGSFGGDFLLEGHSLKEVFGNGLVQSAQKSIAEYVQENCSPKMMSSGKCEIPVKAIAVELTTSNLVTYFSNQISECIEDPNCDAGGAQDEYKKITSSLIDEVSGAMGASLYLGLDELGENIVSYVSAGGNVLEEDFRVVKVLAILGYNSLQEIPDGGGESGWAELIEEKIKDGECDIDCLRSIGDEIGHSYSGINSVYGKYEEELKLLEESLESFDSLLPIEERITNKKYSRLLNFFLTKKTYAQNTNDLSEPNQEVFFLPEYGTYSLEFGPFEYDTQVSDGKTLYLFYFEVNGEEGFQEGEDYVLQSFAQQIKYEKTASSKSISLRKGINIISFEWLPAFDYDDIYTANDLAGRSPNIEYIAHYEGGRWANGISCKVVGECSGRDFVLTPGKGYLVVSSSDTELVLPGYQITSKVPVSLSSGWNLVGLHGYSRAYTAGSFIDSINLLEGLTADNVSWWPVSKGRYEGLQVTDDTEYGFDFPIKSSNGYFVRISEFAPEDQECRSIIWHDGGDLHGTCGHSGGIF